MTTTRKLATVVHGVAKTKEGSAHIVGFGNLRVVITNDDGSWFAQALEIDYAAQGKSMEDVKKRFEHGLAVTIDEHLKIYGSIKMLLQPAPPEVWVELLEHAKLAKRFSQISIHVHQALPFEGIDYFEPEAA